MPLQYPQSQTVFNSTENCYIQKQHIQKQQFISIYIKTMEQNQHHNHNEQEFLKSLKELEEILQENPLVEETATTPLETTPKAAKIDLAIWEDAVADIEQFFESQEKNNQTET